MSDHKPHLPVIGHRAGKTALGRMGSHFREKLAAADKVPTKPPKDPVVGDLHFDTTTGFAWAYTGTGWARVQPTEQERAAHAVSIEAGKLEDLQRVEQALSKAITKRIGAGWLVSSRYDMALQAYVVGIKPTHRWVMGVTGKKTLKLHVHEEKLAHYSQTVPLFNAWVTDICQEAAILVNGTPVVTWGADPINLAAEYEERAEQATDRLREFGAIVVPDYDNAPPFAWEETDPERLRLEEQEAIESIRRALGQ